MPYLVDTDWAIQALAGRPPALGALRQLAPAQVSISLISVGELYEGAFISPNPAAHLMSLRQFLSSFRILNINEPIMERFAEIRALLRRRGELIPDFDMLIGATALHYNLVLLTFNVRHTVSGCILAHYAEETAPGTTPGPGGVRAALSPGTGPGGA